MNIGIFGGCFNPPHKIHESIALELIKSLLDKVIFVPTGNKYNKKDLAPDIHRFNMLKVMCNNNPKLDVSDYEFKELTYTYQTLDYFKSIYPDSNLYFIIGSDNLKEIETWKEYQYLLDNYKIIVIARDKDNAKQVIESKDYLKNNENIIIFDGVKGEWLSSTFIRNIIKNNEDSEDYISSNVKKYIEDNGLYM